MKTRINLYRATLLPVEPRLTLPRLAALSAGLLLLLLLGVAGTQWQLQQQLAQQSQQQQRQQQLQQQVQQRSAQVAAMKPSQSLQAQLAQSKEKLQGMQQVQQLLAQDKFLIEPGYSNLMTDLAATADQQVWLQQFEFANNRLLLTGMAQSAAAVPTWIDKLGSRDSLRGRPIRKLVILGDEGGPVRFEASHGSAEPTKRSKDKGADQ